MTQPDFQGSEGGNKKWKRENETNESFLRVSPTCNLQLTLPYESSGDATNYPWLLHCKRKEKVSLCLKSFSQHSRNGKASEKWLMFCGWLSRKLIRILRKTDLSSVRRKQLCRLEIMVTDTMVVKSKIYFKILSQWVSKFVQLLVNSFKSDIIPFVSRNNRNSGGKSPTFLVAKKNTRAKQFNVPWCKRNTRPENASILAISENTLE